MDEELRDRLKSTSGGSSDTELKELTVSPTGACPGRDAVITATPGAEAVISGRETSECPASAGSLVGEAIV